MPHTDRCGSCGAQLYTDGTCPNCDRGPRVAPLPNAWLDVLALDVEATLLVAAADVEARRAA